MESDKSIPNYEPKNILYKFSIYTIFALLSTFIGLVIFFIIAYGLFRPYVAYGIFLVFLLISLTIMVINLLNIKDNFERANTKVKITIIKYIYIIILTNLFLTILTTSIGLYDTAYTVIDLSYYFSKVFPQIISIYIFILYLSYFLYSLKTNKFLKLNMKKINIIYLVIIVFYLSINLIGYIVSHNNNNNGLSPNYSMVIIFNLIVIISYLVIKQNLIKKMGLL